MYLPHVSCSISLIVHCSCHLLSLVFLVLTNQNVFFFSNNSNLTIPITKVPDSSFDIPDVRSLVGGKRIIEVYIYSYLTISSNYFLQNTVVRKVLMSGDEFSDTTELRDDPEGLGGVLYAP